MTSTNIIAHCEGNCVREKKERAYSCKVDELRGNFDKVSHVAGSNVMPEYSEGMIWSLESTFPISALVKMAL